MVSCLASLWLAASLGQAPDQSAWLKSVPADVAVVVRVKALETVRDDILKMLGAMSGNAAALARPQLETGLSMMEAQSGKESVKHPFFMLMSMPKDGPMPGWAVLVESENYEAVVKSVSKKDDFKSSPKDGLDTFDGPDGQPWHSAKGKGFVAFGPDQALVKAVANPKASLDEKIASDVKKEFSAGDIGVYVNVAALQAKYGAEIEQAKQGFLGLLDQAGGQMDAKTLEMTKTLYAGMFDSVKSGDAVAFSFDFSEYALSISGMATVKADATAAKNLATARSGAADGFGKLPSDGFVYSYMNLSPESYKSMAKLGMSFLGGGGKGTADMEKGQAMLVEAGATELYQAMASGSGGMSGMAALAFSMPKDPAKAVEATTMTNQALKGGNAMFKDVVLTPKVATYKNFALNEMKVTYDLEKMAPPNAPGGADSIKKLMGGDTMTVWYGTDGKTFLNVSGKTLDDAKARIDAFISGENSLAKTPPFDNMRRMLPKDVTMMVIVNAQGLVKFASQTAGAISGKPAPIPADMPKETALFGGSMTASAKGYQVKFVLPSNVGPVIEKGLVPMLQGLTGQIQ
jgi:hypothetical protein